MAQHILDARGLACPEPVLRARQALAETAATAITVLVDGGFRRGTDVFKALALGARAICIGRPYMWGVAAFGQPGVESVLGILRREFNLVMAECGKRSVAQIGPASIIRKSA